VAVTIDEAGHRRQPLRIEGFQSGCGGATCRHRGDSAAPDHDGPLFDDLTSANDDANVGDSQILRGKWAGAEE
jgi:hypothetical protein